MSVELHPSLNCVPHISHCLMTAPLPPEDFFPPPDLALPVVTDVVVVFLMASLETERFSYLYTQPRNIDLHNQEGQ